MEDLSPSDKALGQTADSQAPAPHPSDPSDPVSAPAIQPTQTAIELTARAEETLQEQKLIRRLQMMMNLVMQTIAQDSSLTIDEASQMIADSRKAALAMFPGKDLAYDLIWRPRFQRLMRERFRIM